MFEFQSQKHPDRRIRVANPWYVYRQARLPVHYRPHWWNTSLSLSPPSKTSESFSTQHTRQPGPIPWSWPKRFNLPQRLPFWKFVLVELSVNWSFNRVFFLFPWDTCILLFWLIWWGFFRFLSLPIALGVRSLSSFPAVMLPGEDPLNNELFSIDVHWTVEPLWSVHLEWLLLAQPLPGPAFQPFPDSLSVTVQEFN